MIYLIILGSITGYIFLASIACGICQHKAYFEDKVDMGFAVVLWPLTIIVVTVIYISRWPSRATLSIAKIVEAALDRRQKTGRLRLWIEDKKQAGYESQSEKRKLPLT